MLTTIICCFRFSKTGVDLKHSKILIMDQVWPLLMSLLYVQQLLRNSSTLAMSQVFQWRVFQPMESKQDSGIIAYGANTNMLNPSNVLTFSLIGVTQLLRSALDAHPL